MILRDNCGYQKQLLPLSTVLLIYCNNFSCLLNLSQLFCKTFTILSYPIVINYCCDLYQTDRRYWVNYLFVQEAPLVSFFVCVCWRLLFQRWKDRVTFPNFSAVIFWKITCMCCYFAWIFWCVSHFTLDSAAVCWCHLLQWLLMFGGARVDCSHLGTGAVCRCYIPFDVIVTYPLMSLLHTNWCHCYTPFDVIVPTLWCHCHVLFDVIVMCPFDVFVPNPLILLFVGMTLRCYGSRSSIWCWLLRWLNTSNILTNLWAVRTPYPRRTNANCQRWENNTINTLASLLHFFTKWSCFCLHLVLILLQS